MSTGIDAIAAERRRQIEVEGWTAEHDDEHDQCELSLAGAVYALSGSADSGLRNKDRMSAIRELWPFQSHWFKATGGREDLVKAGALIAAEIDRLDRASARWPNDSKSDAPRRSPANPRRPTWDATSTFTLSARALTAMNA